MGWFTKKTQDTEGEVVQINHGEKLTAQEILNEVEQEDKEKINSLLPEGVEIYGVPE